MRAPPDAANMMNGVCRRTAVSRPVITASPAAMPSEPPMKSKSCTAIVTIWPSSRADAELHRVLQSGLGARILEAVGITALVAKLERIDRDFRQRDIFKFAAVEHALQTHRRADAHVII